MSLVALAALAWRRPYTVLDLWLMVVMCAWFFDIALSAVFSDARFQLGWYAGRLYGLFAACSLLVMLLIENASHYVRLAVLSSDLRATNEILEELSVNDALTNVANRRLFDTYLANQWTIARRFKRPLALVLFDVDLFKGYNDQHGHQAGDECLKQVAAALRSCCRRPADIAARYGGEEFTLILPDTDLAGAAHIAEVARDAVARLQIPHERSLAACHVSVSGGVAVLHREFDMTAEQLIMVADQNLFRAKHLGRNRVVFAQPEILTAPPIPVPLAANQVRHG
jgi:diguanylate cyclase (GGDEF)-like protein